MAEEERIEQTFAVGKAPQLAVSNVRGSITVLSDDREDIHVMAVKRPHGCSHPERTTIELWQDGDCVVAKTHYRDEDSWLSRLFGTRVCAVDYTVHVPASCDVEVKQVSGTVNVNGIRGRVGVNAVSGEVTLNEITGRARVKTVSAAVEGDRWNGRARVETVSGNVEIDAAQLSHVKANTISGDLSLETTLDADGRYDFHSVSGDVTVYLTSQGGVESRGSTISGRLVCDLPHQFTRRSRGGWRATINGGGPPLRFQSVSGDLEVLARTPAPTA